VNLTVLVRNPRVWQLRVQRALVSFLFSAFSLAHAAQLQTVVSHLPAAAKNLAAVGRLPGNQKLHLAVGLPLRNREELTNLIEQLYDPTSPQYRQYLTPEQFAERFGPAVQDYEQLKAFFQTNGFMVSGEHPNRMLLDVDGSVGDIERTLHVTLKTFQHPTEARVFYAPDTEPSLEVSTPLNEISGLDNFSLPKPASLHPIAANSSTPNSGSAPGGAYRGKDFRGAYAAGVTATGTGQSIGLLQFDGYYPADIATYESQAGLTNVPLQNVLLDSFNGSAGANNSEVALDIEMSVAMAPGLSKIIVYEAGPSGQPNDILNRMATDNAAKQLSSSWTWSPFSVTADQIFQQMAAQGQSFFQAAGDDDAYSGSVAKPADDPYVTVVGGTTLSTSSAGGAWSSEKVWNWGLTQGSYVGTGGGISTSYSMPTWQQGITMTSSLGSTSMRNLPDVALTADNIHVVYNNGTTGAFGGTSCATPLWAALTALLNQQSVANGLKPLGFMNPSLYLIGKGTNYSACFHDITSGNNTNGSSPKKFFAVTGFDLCTGWGTPIGAGLMSALARAAASVSATPTNQTAVAGSTVTFLSTVSGISSPAYQWLFNSTNVLPGKTGSTLVLTNVQLAQAGNYSLRVTNASGAFTSSFVQLRVLAVPTISKMTRSGRTNSILVASAAGLKYVLEYKNALSDTNWTALSTMVSGTGGNVVLQDTNSTAPSRFYRIRCQ